MRPLQVGFFFIPVGYHTHLAVDYASRAIGMVVLLIWEPQYVLYAEAVAL